MFFFFFFDTFNFNDPATGTGLDDRNDDSSLRSKKPNATTRLSAKTVGQTIMEITIICIKGEEGRKGGRGSKRKRRFF